MKNQNVNAGGLQNKLERCLNLLSRQEQLILSLYYLEHLSSSEIAGLTGLPDGHVVQLHDTAMRNLQEQLLLARSGNSGLDSYATGI